MIEIDSAPTSSSPNVVRVDEASTSHTDSLKSTEVRGTIGDTLTTLLREANERRAEYDALLLNADADPIDVQHAEMLWRWKMQEIDALKTSL